jgi:hypothetical protein
MILKTFLPKDWLNMGDLDRLNILFMTKTEYSIGFQENANFVAQNSDHNIDFATTDTKQLRQSNSVILFVFENRNLDVLATHVEAGSCSEQKFQVSVSMKLDFGRKVFVKFFTLI